MIVGAHSIVYSEDPDADRSFFKDVLGLGNVDVGGGWLIFELPASELAVHPSEQNNIHEFFLLCDDVSKFIEEMSGKNIDCTEIEKQPWGLLTHVTLPGGGRLGVYEALHERPGAS